MNTLPPVSLNLRRDDAGLLSSTTAGAAHLSSLGRPEKTIIDDPLRQNWSTLHSLSLESPALHFFAKTALIEPSCRSAKNPDSGRTKTVCWGRVYKTDQNAKLKSDILDDRMPNTSERREITSRVNAREAETIQQSKKLVAKTKRFSAIADTKNLARRNQELNSSSRARKNMP